MSIKSATLVTAVIALAAILGSGGSVHAEPVAVYSSIPSPLPNHLPSLGFQATQTDEFGDHVAFTASVASRQLTTVDVVMVSWACQSGNWNGVPSVCTTTPGAMFSHPLTLNLYEADTSVTPPVIGDLIATKTLNFDIPYRPSADPTNCTATTPGATAWYDAAAEECYNGVSFVATFDFTADEIGLPEELIWGLAFNTTNHGAAPIGTDATCFVNNTCPYDSLNVGLSTGATVGTDVDPDGLFWDTSTAVWYTDEGAAGVDIFRFDSGWGGDVPAARFAAESLPAEGQIRVPLSLSIGPVFFLMARLDLADDSDGISPTTEALILTLGEQEVVFPPGSLLGSNLFVRGTVSSGGVQAQVFLLSLGQGRYLLLAFGTGADAFDGDEVTIQIGNDTFAPSEPL